MQEANSISNHYFGNNQLKQPIINSSKFSESISNSESEFELKPPNTKPHYVPELEQSVILKQPKKWSRAILWVLMLSTTSTVVWANYSKLEEAVLATGKLEASGATKDVQAPVGGVVKEVFVEDGKPVQKGQRLLSLDNTTAKAQMESLQKIRTSVIQENLFYQAQLQGTEINIPTSKFSFQMLDLARSRTALLAENKLYRVQLDGASSSQLTLEQRERILSNQAELDARVAAAQSEVDQLKRQVQQTDIRITSTKDTLKMNQGILNNITGLAEQGAISQLQYFKQQEEVRKTQSELDQQVQEKSRIIEVIAQAKAKLQNNIAVSRRDWLNQIADNNKRIAEIDSQITKVIVDNNKKIAELDSQISQTMMNLKYQEITAPVNGTVFELKAKSSGYVVTSSEPILKIVPNDKLVAKVFITNKDIGFVKEGMTVDVRIDSFPFSEFGDIKGKLVQVGSDALPPDQIYPFYKFPAKVELDTQYLLVNGRNIRLQSGMAISTNIKIRDRNVLSIFTDMFSSSIESLKTVR